MKLFRKKQVNKENLIAPGQKERIDVLKSEIYRLEERLKEYEKREREIADIISFTKERAESYEKEARMRYDLERARLSDYRRKWMERLKTLGDADRLGKEIIECNEYFKKISCELKHILEGDEIELSDVQENYDMEKNRLDALGVCEGKEIVLSEEDLNKLLLQYNG